MPFLPLHDDNQLRVIPFQAVTTALIVTCVLVFVWQLSLSEDATGVTFLTLGLVPSSLLGLHPLPVPDAVPASATLLTNVFLHAGWAHLIGNMLYLWVFGDNVEDAMGHVRFLVFFLLCGIAAGVVHSIVNTDSGVPTIGASGAVAGVLGAYLMLHPQVRILCVALKRIPLRLPAHLLLGGWIAMQLYGATQAGGGSPGGVAFWSHIGGFVAGALLVVPFRRRGLPLLGGLVGSRIRV